uniref:Allatostatin-C neuropeptide n=1 Tax=Platynereis dumerilii TaxID=6359 RepID=V5TDI3_PLADU|nr:allatostatin-C neuropeptide precursor [Platynereis dumerilii]
MVDFTAHTLAIVLIINCICIAFAEPAPSELGSVGDYENEHYKSLQGGMLERRLREDIEREMTDVKKLEHQLMGHLNLIQEKKRQLEIKKRQPVQCLVNIVSCWKRK